jgi:segregation and condensation protein A
VLESRAPHVSVEGFEGPLDMLLELIEEQRLDILTVRLGDLAEAYLARIQGLAALPTEEVAGFLVIGARLVLIKARTLLPQEGGELQSEAPESELRERLLEYQVVRERAAALRTRLAGGQRAFHREGGSVDLPPRGGDVTALSAAWEKVLALARSAREEDLVAPGERYNVEDRAREIEELLRGRDRVAFSALVAEKPTLRFAVVTFLAILDLFRRGLVDLEQRELFGEITISLRERSGGG